MANKSEDAKVAPADNGATVEGSSSEKQGDIAQAANTSDKSNDFGPADKEIDEAAGGVGDLSLTDKEKDTLSSKEGETAAASTSAAPPAYSEKVQPTSGPSWPETSPDHPLTKFYTSFEKIVAEAQHAEVYGITLSTASPFLTKLILQKFLRANQNDLEKAKQQLLETLQWRKEFDPVKAATETYSKERFGGLGYVLEVEGVPGSENKRDVATFNIYGVVKDKKATFGDLEGFLRWRVGLMEKSVQKLDLSAATKPIPNFGEGPDPYQSYQIHDYLQVSFLRQDPHVKVATKKTIETLGRYYPETLSRKFFVNVPIVMGWVYTAVKLVISEETAKKFTLLSYGNQLVGELGKSIPSVYGGEAGDLETVAEGMNLA